MPTTRLHISGFRAAWWKRPAMIGVAGGVVLVAALACAAWAALAPRAPIGGGDAPSAASLPELRSFSRAAPDHDALAVIARQNPLSATRTDFTREVQVAEAAAPAQDTGERDRLKRLEDARRALSTLRLVAILRVSEQWIALFEPSVRKVEEDLLSLRAGDVWEGWEIVSIDRQEVRLTFEGHPERVELKPMARKTPTKAAPKGRVIVETRPARGREVTVDPPISASEARQRLLGAAREESDRVREMAEDLLKDLEKED